MPLPSSPQLPLKRSGKLMDVRTGIAHATFLTVVFRGDPHLAEPLLAVARGQRATLSDAVAAELKKAALLRQDGTPRADLMDVLLSGYQFREGPMVVNPFRLDTLADRMLVDRIDSELDRVSRSMLGLEGGK